STATNIWPGRARRRRHPMQTPPRNPVRNGLGSGLGDADDRPAGGPPMAGSLLLGVNLSGAEFGSRVPGTFRVDYTYPTHAEVDYYAGKGLGVIRLPFLWERIQRSEFGALAARSSPGLTTW